LRLAASRRISLHDHPLQTPSVREVVYISWTKGRGQGRVNRFRMPQRVGLSRSMSN
jgi:hypothetical protein